MRTSRVVALALAVATFFVAQEALTDLAAGRPFSLANDVEVVLRFWVIWAALTPVVLAAVRRWPPDAKPIYRAVIIHGAVAVLLAAVQSIVALSLLPIPLNLSLRRHVSPVAFTWNVFTGACFYAVVVMVYTTVRLEGELTRSKLDTLRSQLRPHFLFNTLNAISVLVTEDPGKAREMLLRLSTLLRRSLDEEAHEVTLAQELAFVNDYLEIQRGRFGDQLTVRLRVDPLVLGARVPVFLLQPLLENAIEHGKGEDNLAAIAVSASREHDRLCVTLEDNGPGVGDAAVRHEGIGLRNTRARLHHLYGAHASVQLGAARGTVEPCGTRVEIRIPFNETRP